MPQMAPLSWLILFSSFSLLIILAMNKVWFMNMPYMLDSSGQNSFLPKQETVNWKW